jgi:hypothetical protein
VEQASFGYVTATDIPTLAADMPLLEQLVLRHKAARPLQGVTALLIQHQLGNQAPQIESPWIGIAFA